MQGERKRGTDFANGGIWSRLIFYNISFYKVCQPQPRANVTPGVYQRQRADVFSQRKYVLGCDFVLDKRKNEKAWKKNTETTYARVQTELCTLSLVSVG